MWDGREPNLTSQALDATMGHAQATIVPTMDQLLAIASYEKTFFSSDVLRQYAAGGPAPTWPDGNTDSEKRGRRWFVYNSAAPRFNICGQCHGGPMTNEIQSNSGLVTGSHFETVSVSEFNLANNPTYQFAFPDPKNPGQTITVTTPDPGKALITGKYSDLNFFKIPTLWGIKNTAPYFHDNSAATLNDLMVQYKKHMATFLPATGNYPNPYVPTDQDVADIIAYLNLL
jgi:cytochrome c peroxidase